ncbi:MAG TPA: dockerin, partial [Verrucomicrobia bacterium]|nr:dockerin [Verrucomicrobiota bacterium]
MKTTKFLAGFLVLCQVCASFAAENPVATADALVRYPDYPAAIERDDAYRVRVRQGKKAERLVVWNHCEKSLLEGRTRGGDVNRRFCEFAFAGRPVTVDIAVREDVRCYKVFPARKGLKHTFRKGVISVTLTEPTCFGIQLNDYDKTILSVFADAPEK